MGQSILEVINQVIKISMKYMNTKTKKFVLAALAVSALFGGLFSIVDKGALAASATTTCNNAVWSATLFGTVYPNNGNSTEAWFEWGDDSSLPWQTPHQTFTSDSSYQQELNPLKEHTTYYYQAVARDQDGTARGSMNTFQTGQCSNPIPKTQCSDGIDNDNDGQIDMADYFCTDPGDDDERDPPANPPKCTDPSATNYNGPAPCQYSNPNPNITPGNLTYQCLSNPTRVQLNWTSGQNANSNGIEKGDSYPNDPNGFWAFIGNTSMGDRSYVDYDVIPGTSYKYRIKYAPTVPSNEVTTNCGNVTPTLPTATISANPSNVNYNGSSTVTWGSNNATSCTATGGSNGWSGSRSTSGSFPTGQLQNTTTYSIQCFNSAGASTVQSTTVTVGNNNTCTDPLATNYGGSLPCQYPNNQPNVTISADDTNIDEGDSTTVRWTSTNATSCTGTNGRNGWAGSREVGNNRSFYTSSLSSDVTYTITCFNNAGLSDTDSVTVRVDEDDDNNNDEAPDVTTRPATGVTSNRATLNGRVDGNGSSVDAWFEYGTSRNNLNDETRDEGYGSGSTSYDDQITGLRANTTYYFRAVAENDEDRVEGQILSFYTGDDYIFPEIPNTRPTVVLTADRTSLSYNQATTVRWYSTNATSCYASGGSLGWAGNKNVGTGSFYTGNMTSSRTFSITCSGPGGTTSDSVTIIVGQVQGTTTYRPTGNALILLSTEVDRHQAIVASLDNTRPHPGDEINYTLKYQNVGNASATNLVLRLELPYEVDYMYSTPNNPTRNGQTLIWSLGTLKAGASGTVSVRVRLRTDARAGTVLNFPATLTYNDPSGYPQSVSANTSAIVWGDTTIINTNTNYDANYDGRVLGASVIGSGFFPGSLFEWLLLLILILVLVVLMKYIFNQPSRQVVVTH